MELNSIKRVVLMSYVNEAPVTRPRDYLTTRVNPSVKTELPCRGNVPFKTEMYNYCCARCQIDYPKWYLYNYTVQIVTLNKC